jgi:ATP-binding cassette subfamily B multidrug efflux pump
MSEKFNVLQSAMASSERIFGLLDEPVAIESPAAPLRRPAPGAAHIVFDNVWFTYDPKLSTTEGTEDRRNKPAESSDENWVVRDVSFDVRPGQRVAIVGATGSGKSTLINLLLRFYDVTSGRITIDGVDIRALDLDDVRGLFSLVLQDVHLFSGTIADNIRLGNVSIDDDRVQRAARAVHAEAFIERLPEGYASAVAERGSTLSVGQKQLLSFARALAFNPRILVLDEATSSIDTETELLIRDALNVLMSGRTTIAIAHRLSTIQDMDKILVLHKGQVREAGRHQDLLAQRGIYYKLYQLQYRDQEGRQADTSRQALSAPPL